MENAAVLSPQSGLQQHAERRRNGKIKISAKSKSTTVLKLLMLTLLLLTVYAFWSFDYKEIALGEAVFLLRAYRSTLKRSHYTNTVTTDEMRVVRRISAAFKDIPGGQMLGATYDYTHRLIHFERENEDAGELHRLFQHILEEQIPAAPKAYHRVSDMLRAEGLMDTYPEDNTPPYDVTENLLEFPAPRSARLQTMTRADTGFLSGLSYSVLRGFGQVHPTVGELRSGYVSLEVAYPGMENESIYLGEILLTEVETFHSASDKDQLKLASGYGAVFGRNENKAIAMAVIDRELEQGGDYAAQDQEFVLMHGDCLEMNGFISHLKLPHYVTFQSKLDAVRKTRRRQEHGTD